MKSFITAAAVTLTTNLFLNGSRHYRIGSHQAILSYLRFGKFLVHLLHDGQEDTCLRCNR